MSLSDSRLVPTIESQFGVFSLAQAEAAGLSPSTIRDRVRNGRYDRLHRGVYRIAGTPLTWRAETIGLVLSVPGLAAASHKTAAFMWGMSSIVPDPVEVVTVRHRRAKRLDDQVHESKDLVDDHVEIVDGMPCTTAVRTIVDLGATASPKYVVQCLDTGLRLEILSLGEIERFIARHARSGRNGIGTIRPLVEERRAWENVTESALEDRFRRLLLDAHVPMPDSQLSLHDENDQFIGRFDFAYPESRTLIEIDGEAFHSDSETFQRDRVKQNAAVAAGWKVLRITAQQLSENPEGTITFIREASGLI